MKKRKTLLSYPISCLFFFIFY